MTPGLAALKHVVVLMMENRSFDHMLGASERRQRRVARIDGLTGTETNPDTNGNLVKVEPKAQYQGQLDPDPDHHFAAVHKQIFAGGTTPSMQGFVQSYFDQQRDVNQSKKIMYYFAPEKLPVLTTLVKEFCTCSTAGFRRSRDRRSATGRSRTTARRSGTSAMEHVLRRRAVQEHLRTPARGQQQRARLLLRCRQLDAGSAEPAEESAAALRHLQAVHRRLRRTISCPPIPSSSRTTPITRTPAAATFIASDQHPDHHVREGERFIALVYNALRKNPVLWPKSALLVVYDEHGGTLRPRAAAERRAPTASSRSRRRPARARRSCSTGSACGCRRC